MSSSKGVFEIGFQPDVQHQDAPGTQSKLGPAPAIDQVPDGKGGAKLYQAAGKLKNKKAVITGGDSGIGQSTAVLFAMEGADVFFTYMASEKKDADETVRLVEAKGRKAYAYEADLKAKETCKKVIEAALEKLGAINILFNNHAYQMVQENILSLPEEQWENTFATNIHREFFLLFFLFLLCTYFSLLSHTAHHLPFCSILLPLQIRPSPHDSRRHHHQQRLHQRLHWPARSPGLHFHQRRHCLLHARSLQPVCRQGYPSQCRGSRPSLDASDSLHHVDGCDQAVYQPHGSTRPTF